MMPRGRNGLGLLNKLTGETLIWMHVLCQSSPWARWLIYIQMFNGEALGHMEFGICLPFNGIWFGSGRIWGRAGDLARWKALS